MHDIEAQAVDSPSEFVSNQAKQYAANGGIDVKHPNADNVILLYVRGRKSGQILAFLWCSFDSCRNDY